MAPDGNMVVTFHASNGLIEPERKEMVKGEDGKEHLVTTSLAVIDERTGRMGPIPKELVHKDYFEGKTKKEYKEALNELNASMWRGSLAELNIESLRARDQSFTWCPKVNCRRFAMKA